MSNAWAVSVHLRFSRVPIHPHPCLPRTRIDICCPSLSRRSFKSIACNHSTTFSPSDGTQHQQGSGGSLGPSPDLSLDMQRHGDLLEILTFHAPWSCGLRQYQILPGFFTALLAAFNGEVRNGAFHCTLFIVDVMETTFNDFTREPSDKVEQKDQRTPGRHEQSALEPKIGRKRDADEAGIQDDHEDTFC
ncbi:hypothetical protein K461DRAFT_315742 [Myriangium duriaei CBS 260.36]|uniref:Uncharacterized protein n=1 Tax=Myriangium duriaei CBS 260.36 TaxID=1168546 RepID=A0A9P4MDB8_9PEZI|nr:hypothetical protein K461DRAFT_315742 [Myriangium duriaei CBS 260.36]